MAVRMRRIALFLVLAVGLGACSAATARPAFHAAGGSATSSGSEFVPPAHAFIPQDPAHLARALARTTYALRSSIERWTTRGDPSSGKPPLDVRLQALYQQRFYRELARHDTLARRTIAALPSWARGEAKANVAAGRDIYSLVGPVRHRVRVRVRVPKPAGVLKGFDAEAQRRFSVSWDVLAAINYVESKFGRVVSASSAGAQGPMQFIPSTWQAYGMGGDVHDDHDAILGAANYLHANGAPKNVSRALLRYNPSPLYVDAVLRYAARIRADRRAFYEYYARQVYVRTPQGLRRITGPGL